MGCRKVKRILQYRVPNEIVCLENFAHHVLFLIYPFRNEKELLSGFPTMYPKKRSRSRSVEFYKMVKHTQTIRRKIADELFECVFDRFVGL